MEDLTCYNSPSPTPPAPVHLLRSDGSSPEESLLELQPAFSDHSNDENYQPPDDNAVEGESDGENASPAKKPRKDWTYVGTCQTQDELERLKTSLLCGSRKWTRKSFHQTSDLYSSTEVLKCVEVRKCQCQAQLKVVAECDKYLVYKNEFEHEHNTYYGVGLSHEQKAIIDPLLTSRQAAPKVIERVLRDAGVPAAESKVTTS